MSSVLKEIEDEWFEKGKKQGIEHSELSVLHNLMETMHWSSEKAMEAMGLSPEKCLKYSAMLSQG